MIVTFQEVINEVIRQLGLDSETIETRVLDSIKLRINEVQDVIFFDQDWEWRKRTFYKTTKAPYETGTITITQNSRSVTGSGTTWIDSMKVGYLLINNKAYKIESINSITTLKLAAPMDQESGSGLEYKVIFPDVPLNHEISSIVGDVMIHTSSVSLKHKNRLIQSVSSVGMPVEGALDSRTSEDFYNEGSVSLTQGDTAVTGAGTAWTSEMEGMTFRVNEFSKEYTIKTVNSSTSLVLKESYDGDTGSGKGYKINPSGTQLLTLRNTPDDYYVLTIEALIKPVKLVNNTDISLIPNHMPLIHGAAWLAGSDLESKNPIRIQQARSDFERTLKQLRNSYRVLTNVQWRSENEQKTKGQFDPLSR